MWHGGHPLGWNRGLIQCALTEEIIKRELVIVPDLDSEFRRQFVFNFIQTPKMLLRRNMRATSVKSTKRWKH